MLNNLQNLPTIRFRHVIFKFDKNFEAEFYNDFYTNSLWYIRVALFLSMILVALFGILDIWIVPISKNTTWFIRYAILCPSLLLCIILTFFRFFKYIMQFAMSFECLLVSLGFAVMIAIAQESEPGFRFYYVGFIQVIIAAHVLLRIRFIYATITSWIIIFMYQIVGIYYNGMLSSPELIPLFINNNFFFVSTNFMCMIASFFIEYFIRNDFLLRKRIQYEEELKASKTKAELLRTKLERDYAQQAIFSIEQETDTGLRNIAHSIKNKHMIQDGRNKNIIKKITLLTEAIEKMDKDIPQVLDKTCNLIMNKYKEKILLQVQKKFPGQYEKLSRNSKFFETLKQHIILVFKQRNSEKISNFLLKGIAQNTDEICQALAGSFNNMLDILNYIYAIISYQRGKAVKIGGNVFADLGKIYWHIYRTYRKELTEYNISFKYENHTGDEVLLRVYDFILEDDIIRNLFVNAFRVLVEDDPENKRDDKTIWLRVFLSSQENGNQNYIIHFRDNGPGIPGDKKDAVFKGYSSKKKEYIVTDIETEVEHGIGLLTVKKRINEAGGTIHEEGKHGEGAHFVIVLKRYSKDQAQKKEMDLPLKDEDVISVQTDKVSSLFAGKKLLIVDDDRSIARVIGKIFDDTGMQIMYAGTVDEARDRIYDRYIKPDVIILDLDLGAQRGESILLEMMGSNETIPVVVVSGSERAYYVDKLKSLGVHSVHQKPVDEQTLFNLVKKILLQEKTDDRETISWDNELPVKLKDKTILIVEDEQEARNIIADIFSELKILFAVNNNEAMNIITEHKPDVISLDLGLGKDNGRDLLKWMNQTENLIPTVVVSGELEDEEDETAKELIKMGALRIYRKPFDEEKLYADVLSLIE